MEEMKERFGGLQSTVTYEYVCKSCNAKMEERRHMDHRDDDTQCPDCDGTMLRKFSSFGFKI